MSFRLRFVQVAGGGGESDLDWTTRSTASGVQKASRLSSTSDYAITQDGLQSHVTIETTIKPHAASAGSTKIAVLNGDGANSGQFAVSFSQNYVAGQTFWISYRVYEPFEQAFTAWPGSDGEGNKWTIISNQASSNRPHELVVQDMQNWGRVTGYYQDGVQTAQTAQINVSVNTACNASDFRDPSGIDRDTTDHADYPSPLTGNDPDTGSAWSSCALARRRWGTLYGAISSPGVASVKKGLGDALTGAFRKVPGEWLTVTQRITIGTFGSANNRWVCWVARNNQPYQLMWDAKNIQLGVDAGNQHYNRLWCQPYVTNRSAGGRQITGRTNNIGGVAVRLVSHGCPTGTGVLSYNATNGRFTFTAPGESAGTAVGFSVANKVTLRNVISSVASSYIVLELTDAGSLPSSGTTTDNITIADQRPDTFILYADFIESTANINAPGGYPAVDSDGSALAQLAATMASGTWADFTMGNMNLTLLDAGGGRSVLEWAGFACWDPNRQRISFWGMGHTENDKLLRWDDATNQWSTGPDPNLGPGTFGHSNYFNTMNQANGDLYLGAYDSNQVRRLTGSGTSWSVLTPHPNSAAQVAGGFAWFPEANGGAGGLVHCDQISIDLSNSTVTSWNTIHTGSPLMGAWGNYAVYSGGAVYCGGGNSGDNRMYRVNANGTVTTLGATTPVNVGLYAGTSNTLSHICAHPNGTDLLLFDNTAAKNVYRFDGTSWTDIGTNSVNSGEWYFVCPISNYGVVLMVCQNASAGPPFVRVFKP